jgi:hypothetical protein
MVHDDDEEIVTKIWREGPVRIPTQEILTSHMSKSKLRILQAPKAKKQAKTKRRRKKKQGQSKCSLSLHRRRRRQIKSKPSSSKQGRRRRIIELCPHRHGGK